MNKREQKEEDWNIIIAQSDEALKKCEDLDSYENRPVYTERETALFHKMMRLLEERNGYFVSEKTIKIPSICCFKKVKFQSKVIFRT